MNHSESDNLQSVVINNLRFPLVLMVIFIHQSYAVVDDPATLDILIFNAFYYICSHLLAGVAVPLFFLISGYLYFYKIEEFSKQTYIAKTKRRIKSLALPYLYWNLIAYGVSLVKVIAQVVVNGRPVEDIYAFLQTFSLHIFWDVNTSSGGLWCFGMFEAADSVSPLLVHLWFLRNLFILALISPVIYFLVRRGGKWFVGLLCIACLGEIGIDYSPFTICGIFYFTLGSYLSINKLNISDCFGKFKPIMCYFAVTILIVVCGFAEMAHQDRLLAAVYPTFVLFGVASIYNLAYTLIKVGIFAQQSAVWAQSSFFVYALHALVINKFVGVGLLYAANMLFGEGAFANFMSYMLAPPLVAMACVEIYMLLQRFAPRLLHALSGNR